MQPYRSIPRRVREHDAPKELLLVAETTAALSPGFVSFLVCFTLGGIVGALAGHALVGFGIGLIVGAAAAAVRRRTSDSAGVFFRVSGDSLTIRRGRRGVVLIEAPVQDFVEVKLETVSVSRASNLVASPNFGVHQQGGRDGVDESRVQLRIRARNEPIFLTTNRLSNLDATEWVMSIRRFLRGQGVRQSQELFAIDDETARFSLIAHTQEDSVVFEAHSGTTTAPDRWSIGPEQLQRVFETLLAESGNPPDGEDFDCDQVVELIRETFVLPYGRAAMSKLVKWLEQLGIPYEYHSGSMR